MLEWCRNEKLPLKNGNELAKLAGHLELANPSGVSTKKRGRVVTLEDIERLAVIVEASKIGLD